MKEDETPFDEYRTAYIAARWDVPKNAARALQLFEIGLTVSGATKHLSVTKGTVKSYHRKLQDTIHPEVVQTVSPKKRRFDVFGDQDFNESKSAAAGRKDGKAARARAERRTTQSADEIDPAFRSRKIPVNRGIDLHEIPKHLIGGNPHVEVEQ